MSPRLPHSPLAETNRESALVRWLGRLRRRPQEELLSEFKIEPCDAIVLAADEPLSAPCAFRFRVRYPDEVVTFLARKVRYAEGGEEIWVKRQGVSASLRLRGLSANATLTEVADYYDKNVWSRWIFLDAEFEIASDWQVAVHKVLILKGGLVYWVKGQPYQFKLTGVPERYRWSEYYSTSDIVRLIKKQLKDRGSDCNFALRWSGLTVEERTAWIYHTKRDSLEECERILQLFLGSGDWWEKEQVLLCLLDNLPSKHKPDKVYPNPLENLGLRPQEEENGWIQLSANQRRILSVIDQHFGLHYDEQCRAHQQLGLKRPHSWSLLVKPPTFHERLEARLQLRDWLSDKLLPSEVAALMS